MIMALLTEEVQFWGILAIGGFGGLSGALTVIMGIKTGNTHHLIHGYAGMILACILLTA